MRNKKRCLILNNKSRRNQGERHKNAKRKMEQERKQKTEKTSLPGIKDISQQIKENIIQVKEHIILFFLFTERRKEKESLLCMGVFLFLSSFCILFLIFSLLICFYSLLAPYSSVFSLSFALFYSS